MRGRPAATGLASEAGVGPPELHPADEPLTPRDGVPMTAWSQWVRERVQRSVAERTVTPLPARPIGLEELRARHREAAETARAASPQPTPDPTPTPGARRPRGRTERAAPPRPVERPEVRAALRADAPAWHALAIHACGAEVAPRPFAFPAFSITPPGLFVARARRPDPAPRTPEELDAKIDLLQQALRASRVAEESFGADEILPVAQSEATTIKRIEPVAEAEVDSCADTDDDGAAEATVEHDVPAAPAPSAPRASVTMTIHEWDDRAGSSSAISTEDAVRSSRPRLVVGCDATRGDFLLEGRETQVGRTRSNGVAIRHCSVSKSHARIFWSGRRWVIEDLGSTNRTRVRGVRLGAGMRSELRAHTAIWFGGVPCLFLMEPVTGEVDDEPKAWSVLRVLVSQKLISHYQAKDVLREEKSRLGAIAARFIRKGVVTPEQWESAYATAAAAAACA